MPLSDWLPDELRAELLAQQHSATGDSLKSITCERVADGYIVYGKSYLYWIQYGRKPNKEQGSSGQKTSAMFDAIKQWVKVKGIEEAAVWPIFFKIKKEGYPLQPYTVWTVGNSLTRRDFIGRTITNNKKRVDEDMIAEWEGIIFEKYNELFNTEEEIMI